MGKILGLDLGTNSIGWVLRDTDANDNQFVAKGVTRFDTGVAYVEGIEQPKVKVRTEARGRRRNYQAEKYRKWELLECLIEQGLCPLKKDELNDWRYFKKGQGRKYPTSQIFHNWLKYDFDNDGIPDYERLGASKHDNCYVFRWMAASTAPEHKKLFNDNPHLLGRVLYQIAQRRGFKTTDSQDPEVKLIEEGRKNIVSKEVEVVGVTVLNNLIEKKYSTLGSALYWGQKNNELEDLNNNRIRNRFTYRHYYENEVKHILENLGFDLSTTFSTKVIKAIVWQRPLRSQKGLIGYCTLNSPQKSSSNKFYKPGKKRIPLSHPLYEEFRTWCDINNLKIIPPDNVESSDFLSKVVSPLFERSSNFYFSNKVSKGKNNAKETIIYGLKHKIEETGAKVRTNYDEDTKEADGGKRYNANVFQNWLKEVFGTDWKETLKWEETLLGKNKSYDYLNVEDIWHICYDSIVTKNQTDEFAPKLLQILKLHFPEKTFDIHKIAQIKFVKGYAALSRSAILKILPLLKNGLIYSHAVFLGNLEKVLNRPLSNQDVLNISTDLNRILKEHEQQKEIYSIVNELISDRLSEFGFIAGGSGYQLDEIDSKDIQLKIIQRFGSKKWKLEPQEEQNKVVTEVSQLFLDFLRRKDFSNKSELFHRTPNLKDKLRKYLLEEHKADSTRIQKFLWHPSEQEKYAPAKTAKNENGNLIRNSLGENILFLGNPQPISKGFKNPMAMRTLQELKKLLNYLLANEIIDSKTRIVVEIARELNDTNRRKAYERWQNEKRRKRDEFRIKIEEFISEYNLKISVSEDLLDKYELFEEQKKICLYCGQTIQVVELLNGTIQKEHTIPAKLSNTDELFNLTVAHPHCNSEKAKRIPRQWSERFDDIKNNIKFIYFEFKKYSDLYEKSFGAARIARDKSQKDSIIQDRHYNKMHLDYWKKKYETFMLEEVTNQFRRQQLTDTQIITKYSIPYLKTVFRKVEVQRGTITDKFRRIFQIGPKVKDRREYWHHAMDAAVLTLIPTSTQRDQLLMEYNQAIDENNLNNYTHPKPKDWTDFHQSYITCFKEEILVRHVSKEQIFTPAKKKKRVRGKIVKGPTGKPILLQGDSIRGELHDASIFGMVKIPETYFDNDKGKHRLKLIEGRLSFKQNEKRKEKDFLFIVMRKSISTFKAASDFEALVIDPNLGTYLRKEVERRMKDDHLTFNQAIKNLYAFGKKIDKNGNELKPIRHLRCKVLAGRGFMVNPATVKKVEEAFLSKHKHKQFTYAKNGETPYCAIYQWLEEKEVKRELKVYSLLEATKSRKLNGDDFVEKEIPFKKGKIHYVKRLLAILYRGQTVLFYKNDLNELKEFQANDPIQLNKRMYTIVKFVDGFIFFKHHMTALKPEQISNAMKEKGFKKEETKINFGNMALYYKLAQGELNMAIQDVHFKLSPDGRLQWLV